MEDGKRDFMYETSGGLSKIREEKGRPGGT